MCGICGKINKNSLCKKCEIALRSQAVFNIDNYSKDSDKYFNEHIYIFMYENQIRNLILKYKFQNKAYLYKTFTNFFINNKKILGKIQNYDIIIPVPISKRRDKQRGYNQSELIAKEIGKFTKINVLQNCIIKDKDIIAQSKLNKEQRQNNIKNAYKIRKEEIINNKNILIIDDIYTTGSTVNECSRILRKANPKNIGILTIAKD